MWILTCSFSQLFFCIYQLRIGTKTAFVFHNHWSVQISVISSNLKIKKKFIWNYFMSTYISNFHQYIFNKNYILQISNLHLIFHFYFSQLNKVCFFSLFWLRWQIVLVKLLQHVRSYITLISDWNHS
jgi:hypothetical protein